MRGVGDGEYEKAGRVYQPSDGASLTFELGTDVCRRNDIYRLPHELDARKAVLLSKCRVRVSGYLLGAASSQLSLWATGACAAPSHRRLPGTGLERCKWQDAAGLHLLIPLAHLTRLFS